MIINMNGAKAPETPSSVLQEKTVTPETLPTVIGPDEGYDGLTQVTVNPDSQLKAENIRSGKTIFGVTGTFEGEAVLTPVNTFEYLYENGLNASASVSVTRTSSSITYTTPGASSASPSRSYYRPFYPMQGYGDDGSCIVVSQFSMVTSMSIPVYPVEYYYASVDFNTYNITNVRFSPQNRSGTDIPSGTTVTVDMDYVVTLQGSAGNVSDSFELQHYTGTGTLSSTYGNPSGYYNACDVKLDTPLTIPAGNVECVFESMQTTVYPSIVVTRGKITW